MDKINWQAQIKKYLFFISGILLVWYVIQIIDLVGLLRNPKRIAAYLTYNDLMGAVIPIIILLIFLWIIGSSLWSNVSVPSSGVVRMWVGGFGGTLILLLGFVIYVNPHGVFPWNPLSGFLQTTAYIPTAARTQKIMLLSDLDYAPDIILLGSSRAHTISSAKFRSETGLRTFNMAVNGGLPFDFSAFGEYIFEKQSPPPSIIVVELLMPTRDNDRNSLLPVSMIPYLDYEDQTQVARDTFLDLFNLQSFTDAIYQVSFARLYPTRPAMTFMPDGTGVRVPITKANYENGIDRLANTFGQGNKCLGEDEMRYLEQLIKLSYKNQTAIFFYRSPLNADYLERTDANHVVLEKCRDEFATYMTDLHMNYPNIFFRDLTFYEPISSLRWDGYYDIHHLKPKAASLLVEVIAPDVLKANDWAIQQRAGNYSE